MRKIVMGRTGLEVSRVAFGGLFVASFATQLDEAKRALRRAVVPFRPTGAPFGIGWLMGSPFNYPGQGKC